MKERCGCENVPDPEWVVLHCIHKCDKHQAKQGKKGGRALYEEMCAVVDGIPRHREYIRQLLEPLASVGVTIPERYDGKALEIGCGLGMYAPLFMSRGYSYEACDRDPYACEWVRSCFDVPATCCPFEAYETAKRFDAIMAAHVFEHFMDAPAMMRKAMNLLVPGGSLYLIVPDDSDRLNADHVWFFTVETLTGVLGRLGFAGIKTAVRKHVPRENFIYCAAVRT